MTEKSYSKEEYWELYQKLPAELRELMFSENVANRIGDIKKRYGIAPNNTFLSEIVGKIILGLIPPADLKQHLSREGDIRPEVSEKITREVNRFILFPVKNLLQGLLFPIENPAESMGFDERKRRVKKQAPRPEKQSNKDPYRENIENGSNE